MKFSERVGFVEPRTIIQKDHIDDALRNLLWQLVLDEVFAHRVLLGNTLRSIWINFFKLPTDSMPIGRTVRGDATYGECINIVRRKFFIYKFWEVYDFIEFCAGIAPEKYDFKNRCNEILKQECSAYRFINDVLTGITSECEIAELESALSIADMYDAPRKHLNAALRLYSQKPHADYRNSIKESISSIESMAIIISGKSKAKLQDALVVLQEKSYLHGAMKDAFLKLYGYTSDAGGIRHAMVEASSVDEKEARFMLVACSAFVNYLIEAAA